MERRETELDRSENEAMEKEREAARREGDMSDLFELDPFDIPWAEKNTVELLEVWAVSLKFFW